MCVWSDPSEHLSAGSCAPIKTARCTLPLEGSSSFRLESQRQLVCDHSGPWIQPLAVTQSVYRHQASEVFDLVKETVTKLVSIYLNARLFCCDGRLRLCFYSLKALTSG